MLAVLLLAGCSDDAASGAEGQSLDACRSEVEQRTGEAFSKAEPRWRMTSRSEAGGYVINIWTETPREAQRPVGAPDYVCVTQRDSDAEHGVRLVELRP